MAAENARLQVYLEPAAPLDLVEFTAALGSLARQYQEFAVTAGLAGKASEAKLLVASVSPGSIDISLVPDFGLVMTASPLLIPLLDKYEIIERFAKRIKKLLDMFLDDEKAGGSTEISVRDCDDAMNISRPTATHGGRQTFNTINGGVTVNVLTMSTAQARTILEKAGEKRAALIGASTAPPEKYQRVAMTWNRLAKEKAKTEGSRSPDRALIEELDPKAHAVLFTDDLSYLKQEMIADSENPLQQVYFVDVEVSRAGGKIAAYRITGYHGKEDLPRADE